MIWVYYLVGVVVLVVVVIVAVVVVVVIIVVFLATVTTRYCTTVENTHPPLTHLYPVVISNSQKKNVPQSRFDYTGWKLGP